MGSLRNRILRALNDLRREELERFKWQLGEPENVAGCDALTKRALEDADTNEKVVNLIAENFPGKECEIMTTILSKVSRRDLAKMFGNTPPGGLWAVGGPVIPASTIRQDYLKYSSPLSLDPNTVNRKLLLSENNRKVTRTDEDQPYADHPLRFTCCPNVLSKECISDMRYYEVEWSGEEVDIAVCQDDVNRKDEDLSGFGETPQSWMLWYSDNYKRYLFSHNNNQTEVSGPVPSTGGSHRVGVYVDPPAGVLCFFDVCGNTMSLLHTERTTFTRPLYAGICVDKATAEVCKIW